MVGLEGVRLLHEQALSARAAEVGERVRTALAALCRSTPWIREVRGRGLLLGLELADPVGLPGLLLDGPGRRALLDRFGGSLALLTARYLLQTQGLLVGPTSGDRRVLRLTPPLTLEEAGIERILDAFAAAGRAGPLGMLAALAAGAVA